MFEARAPPQLDARGSARSARRAAARARRRALRASSGPARPAAPRSSARSPARARAERRAKRAHACSRVSTTNPAGFSASEATFATSLFGPIPTEHVSSVRAPDLRDQPAHRRARREQPGQVEVGLVEPDDLDALDVRAHDLHHLARGLAVGREVGRQERPPAGTAAAPARRASPSRRRSCGPRSWRWSRPRAGRCPRRHGLAAQLRTAAQLDRDVEGVGVEVGDAQLGGLDGHCPSNLAPRAAGPVIRARSSTRHARRCRSPRRVWFAARTEKGHTHMDAVNHQFRLAARPVGLPQAGRLVATPRSPSPSRARARCSSRCCTCLWIRRCAAG